MQQKTSKKEKLVLEIVGKTIKEQREKQNLSLNIFAFENNLQKSLLSRIENGKNEIKILSLWKIAKGLNMPLSKLIEIIEQKLGNNFNFED